MITRPLTGEPLALDLLNTRWPDHGVWQDVFDEPGGVAEWLLENGLGAEGGGEPALRRVRDVLRDVVERPGDDAEGALNEVLRRGRLQPVLVAGRPEHLPDVAPQWRAAWLAAVSYLDLVRERPDRIRQCAGPVCTLYFYDTSRNGGRRWCSMEACGNRVKAARHYARSRSGG